MEHVLLVARILFVALVAFCVAEGLACHDHGAMPMEDATAMAPKPVHVERPYTPCGYHQEYGGARGWTCSMGDRF